MLICEQTLLITGSGFAVQQRATSLPEGFGLYRSRWIVQNNAGIWFCWNINFHPFPAKLSIIFHRNGPYVKFVISDLLQRISTSYTNVWRQICERICHGWKFYDKSADEFLRWWLVIGSPAYRLVIVLSFVINYNNFVRETSQWALLTRRSSVNLLVTIGVAMCSKSVGFIRLGT